MIENQQQQGGGRGAQKNGIWVFYTVLRNVGLNTELGKCSVFCETLLQCCLLLDILAPGRCELKISIVAHKEMKDYFGGEKSVASADAVLE